MHDIADTIFGDQVLHVQINRRRPDARAVLHMRAHLGGEGCAGLTAAATPAPRCLAAFDLVGIGHRAQRIAPMPRLAAALLARDTA